MFKMFKILRAIIVNLGIIGLAAYALYLGADPTVSLISSLAVLGAYNGLELGDYMALLQAYNELQSERGANIAETPDEDPRGSNED